MVVKEEFKINLNDAKYFAGHSLGEYSALSCAGYLDFKQTIRILRTRGNAMQNSVPKGEGGMLAILGSSIEDIEKILKDNEKNFKAYIGKFFIFSIRKQKCQEEGLQTKTGE